jgi:hypothetical protein
MHKLLVDFYALVPIDDLETFNAKSLTCRLICLESLALPYYKYLVSIICCLTGKALSSADS